MVHVTFVAEAKGVDETRGLIEGGPAAVGHTFELSFEQDPKKPVDSPPAHGHVIGRRRSPMESLL